MSELQSKEAFSKLIKQGNAALANHDVPTAIVNFRQSLTFKPRSAKIYTKLCYLYLQVNDFSKALSCAEQATQLRPTLAAAHLNQAESLLALNRVDESIKSCRLAIEANPQAADAHYSLASKLLLTEQFEAGWQEYEARLSLEAMQLPKLTIPPWDGSSLVGKSLVVVAEQGLGDTIQFIRYVKLLKSQGATLKVYCQRKLIPLLSCLTEIDALITDSKQAENCDYYVPLLSLPGIFHTTTTSIPSEPHYLSIDPLKIAEWEQRMATLKSLKVGICWQGNPHHALDSRRSISLQQLSPLKCHHDITWISLQSGAGTEQLKSGPSLDSVDYGDKLNNFVDTAACIMNCDLVISVDSALCHLAGALGKPVWTLLHTPSDWRWFQDESTTPWYPSMRLFRQETPLDWTPVIKQVDQTLTRLKSSYLASKKSTTASLGAPHAP